MVKLTNTPNTYALEFIKFARTLVQDIVVNILILLGWIMLLVINDVVTMLAGCYSLPVLPPSFAGSLRNAFLYVIVPLAAFPFGIALINWFRAQAKSKTFAETGRFITVGFLVWMIELGLQMRPMPKYESSCYFGPGGVVLFPFPLITVFIALICGECWALYKMKRPGNQSSI
jgi:hypothetical protein